MAVVDVVLPSVPGGPVSELDVLEAAAVAVARIPWVERARAGLREDVLQMTRVERLVASAKVGMLGAFDASGEYRADLHPSVSTWLAARAKADRRRVAHQVSVARTVRSMPLVEEAFAAGMIGFEHVAVLARVWAPASAEAFTAAEAELVAAAQTLDFDVFCRAARAWRDYVDPDGAEERARRQMERREAHASRTLDGMVRVDAWLDAIGGTEFLAELHRIEKQMFEADWAAAREAFGDRATQFQLGRTAAQRRADAMVEMARRSNTCENPAQPPTWVLNVMMGHATAMAEAEAAAREAAAHEPGCPHAAASPQHDDDERVDDEVAFDDLADLEDLADLGDDPSTGGPHEQTCGHDPEDDGATAPSDEPASPPAPTPAVDPNASANPAAATPAMLAPRSPLPDWWRAVDPRPNAGLADPAMYDRMCELEDHTPISPSQAFALGLAGWWRRVIFGADSHILDFGQAVPYLPEPLKEAVRIRDRECRDHGCSVPARACEIDHFIPRSKGGATSVRNSRCECKTGNRLKGDHMPDREPERD